MPDLIGFYKSIYFINRLFANIYQYKVDNIILPKSALCMLHKKDAHIPFFFYNQNDIETKTNVFLMLTNFFFTGHVLKNV